MTWTEGGQTQCLWLTIGQMSLSCREWMCEGVVMWRLWTCWADWVWGYRLFQPLQIQKLNKFMCEVRVSSFSLTGSDQEQQDKLQCERFSCFVSVSSITCILCSGCLSTPLLWTRYPKNTFREFLQIWCKHSLGLKDELICFCDVNVISYGRLEGMVLQCLTITQATQEPASQFPVFIIKIMKQGFVCAAKFVNKRGSTYPAWRCCQSRPDMHFLKLLTRPSTWAHCCQIRWFSIQLINCFI